jgi:hypothetical protein
VKALGRATAAFALAFLLVLAAARRSDAAHAQHAATTTGFDGVWSVTVITEIGPCDASYRYPARIVRGRVMQADNDFSYQLAGAVRRNGAIVVIVSRGGQSATGTGRLHAATGSGQWSAGSLCSGVWTAVRRRLPI